MIQKSLYAKPVWFCHTETQNFLHAVPLCFMNDLYRHACTHPALSCLFPLTAGDPSKPTQYHLLIHNAFDSFQPAAPRRVHNFTLTASHASGSSLISIPLLLFLFIAFHFLFYIITYLFRVPQGVILSILLIYFNLLYLKLKIFIIFRCKTMIDQMAALIRDAVTVIIRHPILKVNQIIKFPVCRPFYMYMI